MAFLRVPERLAPAFKKLAALPADSLSQLSSALANASPALMLRDLAIDVGARAPGIAAPDLYEIMLLCVSLLVERASQDLPVPEFLREVRLAATSGGVVDDAAWLRLEPFLSQVLGLERTLGVTAKSLDVMRQHERVFCTSRVLTDIRPIFSSDESGLAPSAAVVIHTLKLEFHADGEDEPKEFFIAMDTHDLKNLRKQLERAEQKEAALLKVWPVALPVLRDKSRQ